jgi:hypothetical protein
VRRRARKCVVKSPGSTGELQRGLRVLRKLGAAGTLGGAVKCVEIERNADGEDRRLGLS